MKRPPSASLATSDEARLDRWIERVLTALSLGEVLEG